MEPEYPIRLLQKAMQDLLRQLEIQPLKIMGLSSPNLCLRSIKASLSV
jgi:hypothetical protein